MTNQEMITWWLYFPMFHHIWRFSSRENTWKEIDGTHFAYVVDPSHGKGFLFNGAIHWLACVMIYNWILLLSFFESLSHYLAIVGQGSKVNQVSWVRSGTLRSFPEITILGYGR
jgi:hypothetical protein